MSGHRNRSSSDRLHKSFSTFSYCHLVVNPSRRCLFPIARRWKTSPASAPGYVGIQRRKLTFYGPNIHLNRPKTSHVSRPRPLPSPHLSVAGKDNTPCFIWSRLRVTVLPVLFSRNVTVPPSSLRERISTSGSRGKDSRRRPHRIIGDLLRDPDSSADDSDSCEDDQPRNHEQNPHNGTDCLPLETALADRRLA